MQEGAICGTGSESARGPGTDVEVPAWDRSEADFCELFRARTEEVTGPSSLGNVNPAEFALPGFDSRVALVRFGATWTPFKRARPKQSPSHDDGNAGGAFALDIATRRGRARPRASIHAFGLMFWLTLNRLLGSYFALIEARRS
ncbi:hypothetical protein LMG27174_06580 [Paraburkholderia rhynchosiae]|uniref:Uncharacterized protein n=1 Tax=Paraburkholderia rhynchosiae TaxID=487049 RepID=A0A6J5CLI7_9BURK|nr:hypothetical protein LMG27174_06580 [Paraburkholderia rhynchosiae]